MKLTDAYTAGLFDGEGSLQIARAKGSLYRAKREWAFQCRATLALREKNIIEGLQETFGGSIRQLKKQSEKHSDYFSWYISGLNVLKFVDGPGQLLIAKYEHGQVVKKFQMRKILQSTRPLTDETYEFYQTCWEELKKLNQKGLGK
jgi:hypothetical protein